MLPDQKEVVTADQVSQNGQVGVVIGGGEPVQSAGALTNHAGGSHQGQRNLRSTGFMTKEQCV